MEMTYKMGYKGFKINLEAIAKFQDDLNPGHYGCRLIDIGIGKDDAKIISMAYENGIYKPIWKVILPYYTLSRTENGAIDELLRQEKMDLLKKYKKIHL